MFRRPTTVERGSASKKGATCGTRGGSGGRGWSEITTEGNMQTGRILLGKRGRIPQKEKPATRGKTE